MHMQCRNCNDYGHFARDCLSEKKRGIYQRPNQGVPAADSAEKKITEATEKRLAEMEKNYTSMKDMVSEVHKALVQDRVASKGTAQLNVVEQNIQDEVRDEVMSQIDSECKQINMTHASPRDEDRMNVMERNMAEMLKTVSNIPNIVSDRMIAAMTNDPYGAMSAMDTATVIGDSELARLVMLEEAKGNEFPNSHQ
jgi:phosphoenolpyruvate-protein kinase (PTS system EI component)